MTDARRPGLNFPMRKPTPKPTVPALPPHEARILKLRQLAERIATDFLIFADVALEALDAQDYVKFGFLSEQEWMEEAIGVSYRQVRKLLSVVAWLRGLPEGERKSAAAALSQVGLEKSSILSPALKADPKAWPAWVEKAAHSHREALQEAVSKATRAKPRGKRAEPSRVVKCLKAALPLDLHDHLDAVVAAVQQVGDTQDDVVVIRHMLSVVEADLAAQGVEVTP